MTEQLSVYRKYASFIKRMLFYAGLWPEENNRSSYLYRHLPILIVLSGTTMFYGTLRFCLDNLDNVKVLTRGLSPLGSFLVVAVKALMFLLYREQLRELNLNLELMFEEVLDKVYYRSVALSSLDRFKRPAYIFYYLTGITIILLTCTPLILIVYEIVKNGNPKNYVLPFPSIFPWIDGSLGIRYQVQFLFEIQMCWFIVFVTSGVDSAYGFYIFQMIGIMRVMSLECETIGKSSEVNDFIIRNCARKQIILLRCRDIIQNIYGPVVLNLMLCSVVILCALIFQLLQTEISIGKAVVALLYGMVKMTQAFLYSWYGSILINESEAFRRSVYCSEWYRNGNVELMKGVLLTLIQKPIVLSACHLFYISLDLFVKILNTSLSYYFLLQTFDEANDKR